MQYRAPMRTVLVVTTLLLGCGTPASEDLAPDAATPDAAEPSPDAPTPPPIVVPPATWTFVPIEGSVCNHGTPTGIGVRLEPGSKELLIYLQGGGACSSGPSCWSEPSATNLSGYGAAEFAVEPQLTGYALLGTGSDNPFAGMNMVMVPYCTGDVHAGNRVVELDDNGTTRESHFVGAANLDRMLVRLAATFPDLERVFLVGTSAGGGGATFNFSKVSATLATTVHTIIDSAPGFADVGDEMKFDLWGVTPVCPTCETAADVRRYNRSLDPASRYGFLSFLFDPTTANDRTPEDFADLIAALRTELAQDPNARSFIVDNSAYDCDQLPRGSCHVVTTKNQPPALRMAHLRWLRAFVAGSGWEDITLTPP